MKKTYTVVVNRGADESDDATLKQLQLDKKLINLSANQTEYEVSVGNGTDTVTVKATANDNKAKVAIDDKAIRR